MDQRVRRRPIPIGAVMLGRFVSLAMPLLFLVLGIVRARPFVDDVSLATSAGDDWLTYKQFALSILHDGWTLPAVHGPYIGPRGFLYNYFLAATFALVGVNTSYVYVIQSVLLGLTVCGAHLLYQSKISPGLFLVYLVTLTVYLTADFFRYYTFRLLSENLILPLIPLVLLLIINSYEQRSVPLAVVAGFVLGLALLTRPNLILMLPVITLILWSYRSHYPETAYALPLSFFVACCVTFSFMVLRNYAITRHFSIATLTASDADRPQLPAPVPGLVANFTNSGRVVLSFYARRILFALGFTRLLSPDLQMIRPHWIIMWSAFGRFVYLKIRRRQPWQFWETCSFSFVVCYVLPLIAVAPLSNYGFRMLVPVFPVVLFFGFKGWEMGSQQDTDGWHPSNVASRKCCHSQKPETRVSGL